MKTLIFDWIPYLANRLWGNEENPNWLKSTLLYPEALKSRRHGAWQLMMILAEWAERFSSWIQRQYNDAGEGEWAIAMAEEIKDE